MGSCFSSIAALVLSRLENGMILKEKNVRFPAKLLCSATHHATIKIKEKNNLSTVLNNAHAQKSVAQRNNVKKVKLGLQFAIFICLIPSRSHRILSLSSIILNLEFN